MKIYTPEGKGDYSLTLHPFWPATADGLALQRALAVALARWEKPLTDGRGKEVVDQEGEQRKSSNKTNLLKNYISKPTTNV